MMPVGGGLAQEERKAMLCAQMPALEALAVELSESADGRHPLDEVYMEAAVALSATKEGEKRLFSVTRGLGEPPVKRLDALQARGLPL